MEKEIINENARRRAANAAPFDPLTGEGSPGERFPAHIAGLPADLGGGSDILLLPLAMKGEPVTSRLLQAGSLREAAVADLRCQGHEKNHDEGIAAKCRRLEQDFLRERMLHDFPFWAASFASIKRKGGGDDVKFFLNRPQRRFVALAEEMRTAGLPIRIILLKARQWGGSTCSQLYMAWLQLVHRTGLNSLIIAHQGSGSDEIKDMFDRMINAYPLHLLHEPGEEFPPREKKLEAAGKSRSAYRVPQRNCKVKIGSAERPDSCRGGDYNLVHLSEVGVWKATEGKRPEDIVRSACSGVLLQPYTMIVLESTANGTGNYFHREYLAARRGESQYRPLFVSWYEIDQYELSFASDADRLAFARDLWECRDSEEGTSRRRPGAYLWRLWQQGATLEALHWYVAERTKYSDDGGMASEYPSDDVEAFSYSGSRVFDPYRVEQLRAGCREPRVRGHLEADGYEGRAALSNIRFCREPEGSLKIWEMPADDGMPVAGRYLTAVDVGGRSAKADWSVVTVFDRLPLLDGAPVEVVAQWRGHLDIDRLTVEAARIAAFYNNALLVIESNSIEGRDTGERLYDGDTVPYVMRLLSDMYDNLYARSAPSTDVSPGAPLRYGFQTNRQTKPMIISSLIRCVRDGLYVERDTDAIEELLQYEQRPDGSYGAIAGCHDDILMTRAIGLHISAYEMDMPRRLLPATPRRRFRRPPLSEADFGY